MQNPITTGDVLTYDEETGQWQNCPFEFLLEDYAPTLTAETDNMSIETIEGVLQLKDFGIGYYAYVPAVKDEETGEIITPSTYKYTEGFISGLEPRIIADENKNLCLAWYEPGIETVEDIAANIEDISKSLDSLNQAINAENGLSDQIESLQTQTNQISNDLEAVKSNKADSNSVYTKDEIDESFENVYTKEEIDSTFEDVYTQEEIDNYLNNIYTKEETNIEIGKAVAAADHLKRVIVESKDEIINNYFDREDYDTYIFMIPTGLEEDSNKYDEYLIVNIDGMKAIEKVGSWEVNLSDYATKQEIGYVEGSRLITSDEVTKLTSIQERAERNIINSISSEFEFSGDRQLNIRSISTEKITDLADWLNNNAGTTDFKGLSENNLTDDLYNKLVEAMFISSVSDQLKVDESGKLSILNINSNQVKGLEDLLEEKASKSSVLSLENSVLSISNVLNSMKSTVTQHTTDIELLKDQLIWHDVTD